MENGGGLLLLLLTATQLEILISAQLSTQLSLSAQLSTQLSAVIGEVTVVRSRRCVLRRYVFCRYFGVDEC